MSGLPPRNPRQKKPRVPKGPTIVQRSMSDPAHITKGVPDEIKIAVASAIMAFSDMEMSAEQFIWDVLGLSIDDGKLVTQSDTKEKIELAKKLSERYRLALHPSAQTTADAWTAIRNAIESRNKMAHGVWVTIDEVPFVVSYRIPIELGRANHRSQFYKDITIPFYGFNRPGAVVSEGIRENWWRQGMMGSIQAQYECIRVLSETEFYDDLAIIDVPVLVMHGEDDQICPFPTTGARSVKLLKHGVLKSYPGFPHGMPTTHADVINADLLAFIKG
jgi:pimeloyl-ACP methyl ester carboxylesterase